MHIDGKSVFYKMDEELYIFQWSKENEKQRIKHTLDHVKALQEIIATLDSPLVIDISIRCVGLYIQQNAYTIPGIIELYWKNLLVKVSPNGNATAEYILPNGQKRERKYFFYNDGLQLLANDVRNYLSGHML